ncbi:PLC-like phosphodiesterase [Pleurostoma richardsiae]|uniref:PLC-like phosphodiesterase n=1 Tax=Pleurostoma richardsiae TaxID=41990 RepID=A0AA38RB24_9PEZI|nr:PLC-like phosphodiesterase [Pleurostoma richardsiae]
MRSFLSLATALSLALATTVLAATACNGNTALCSRLYSNVSLVGAHNSAFVGELPQQNQYISVKDQLDIGVRYLQAQTQEFLGQIRMCHTSCLLLDQGDLEDYLTPIKSWIDSHPNDVVTLLLTNPDAIPVSEYGAVFTKVGLDQYAFTPSTTLALSQWPTLQSMINAGTRLVVFMDYHSDTTAVPYILDEFSYYFETPYDTTDASFPQCTLDRPAGAAAGGRMFIMNHMLDVEILGIKVPNRLEAPTTNSENSILAQADLCASLYGRVPNVVLLDYIDKGNAIAAQNALNNV